MKSIEGHVKGLHSLLLALRDYGFCVSSLFSVCSCFSFVLFHVSDLSVCFFYVFMFSLLISTKSICVLHRLLHTFLPRFTCASTHFPEITRRKVLTVKGESCLVVTIARSSHQCSLFYFTFHVSKPCFSVCLYSCSHSGSDFCPFSSSFPSLSQPRRTRRILFLFPVLSSSLSLFQIRFLSQPRGAHWILSLSPFLFLSLSWIQIRFPSQPRRALWTLFPFLLQSSLSLI